MKGSKRLDRNRLTGALGAQVTMVLSAADMNFHNFLNALGNLPSSLVPFVASLLELVRRSHPTATPLAGASQNAFFSIDELSTRLSNLSPSTSHLQSTLNLRRRPPA